MINNITDSIPDELMSWLLYKDFLMIKLKNICSNIQLEVLDQNWHDVSWWEKYHLQISHKVLRREIVVKGDDQICWYARTILPEKTYQNNLQLFNRLKNEPLGNLLFDPKNGIKRENFRYYPINSDYIEYHFLDTIRFKNSDKTLWMRLSTFSFQQNDIFFLVEIFLPDFLSLIRDKKNAEK